MTMAKYFFPAIPARGRPRWRTWRISAICAVLCLVPAVVALDLPLDGDDGYLPVASPPVGDRETTVDDQLRRLAVPPEVPEAPVADHLPATPGEAVLAGRRRARETVDALSAWLLTRRPEFLRARFGTLRAEKGSTVALPMELSIDENAYGRIAAEFARLVEAYTGVAGTLVEMPLHAERLAGDVLWMAPPWRVPPDGNGGGVNGGNGNGGNGNGGNGARAAYDGPMNLLVCLSLAESPAPAVWPAEKDLVPQYRARWLVFDLEPAVVRGLIRSLTSWHPFHVRAQLCDQAGGPVTAPGTDGGATFAVKGIFLAPTPWHLVMLPRLVERGEGRADAVSAPFMAGAPAVDAAELLGPRPAGVAAPWRRLARFDVPDERLAAAAVFRCRYGTGCFPGEVADFCPLHFDGRVP